MKKILVLILAVLFQAVSVCAAEEAQPPRRIPARDPFIPLITSDGRLRDIDTAMSSDAKLEGIIIDIVHPEKSYALINGKVVKAGDEVNGYSVIRMEDNKVFLFRDGEAKELSISTVKYDETAVNQ